MSAVPQDFDTEAPEDFDSAHRDYARLRRECPVAHSHGLGGFWALTKYDDVKQAAADPATFITSVQNVIPKVAYTGRRPPLHLDPPDHTPSRRALNPLLSIERSESFAPRKRPSKSLLPPGGNGMTQRMGLVGKSAPTAGAAWSPCDAGPATSAAARTNHERPEGFMPDSSSFDVACPELQPVFGKA